MHRSATGAPRRKTPRNCEWFRLLLDLIWATMTQSWGYGVTPRSSRRSTMQGQPHEEAQQRGGAGLQFSIALGSHRDTFQKPKLLLWRNAVASKFALRLGPALLAVVVRGVDVTRE